MNDLIRKPLGEIVGLIRNRDVSPVEVAEAHLQQISRLNPTLNAVVTVAPDVIERAKQAEAAVMRGDELGPLHGAPMTIKDTIETAGLRSTSGSGMRADYVPKRDAPIVARLKAAGAIILGKTNTAEMAMDYTADNPVFGRTNHPLDPKLTPGGSSGGEAVAIATCMSAAGFGSDLAGSLRIPAHFCGITALKPTTGCFPGEGQFPPSTGPYSLGAVVGPMARRVRDLLGLLAVIGNENYFGRPYDMRRVRVAWYTDDGIAPVTEETARAVASVVNVLEDAGLIVEERRPPHVERGNEIWLKLFSRASVVQLRDVYENHEELGGDFVRWRLARAADEQPPELDKYIRWWMERDRLRAELIDWMNDTPLLVAPVGATPAFAHGTHKLTVGEETVSTFRAFSYSQTFNVFDLPSVAVPAGRSAEGLPIGVQIVGRPFAEQTVLAAAAIVEKALSNKV